jgi:hypothetical protein
VKPSNVRLPNHSIPRQPIKNNTLDFGNAIANKKKLTQNLAALFLYFSSALCP